MKENRNQDDDGDGGDYDDDDDDGCNSGGGSEASLLHPEPWTAPAANERHDSAVFKQERDFVKYPFEDMGAWEHFRENLKKRLEGRSTEGLAILNSFPDDLHDLLANIFEYDPTLRYTAAQILEAPWMQVSGVTAEALSHY
jgi:hypothetical protein